MSSYEKRIRKRALMVHLDGRGSQMSMTWRNSANDLRVRFSASVSGSLAQGGHQIFSKESFQQACPAGFERWAMAL